MSAIRRWPASSASRNPYFPLWWDRDPDERQRFIYSLARTVGLPDEYCTGALGRRIFPAAADSARDCAPRAGGDQDGAIRAAVSQSAANSYPHCDRPSREVEVSLPQGETIWRREKAWAARAREQNSLSNWPLHAVSSPCGVASRTLAQTTGRPGTSASVGLQRGWRHVFPDELLRARRQILGQGQGALRLRSAGRSPGDGWVSRHKRDDRRNLDGSDLSTMTSIGLDLFRSARRDLSQVAYGALGGCDTAHGRPGIAQHG